MTEPTLDELLAEYETMRCPDHPDAPLTLWCGAMACTVCRSAICYECRRTGASPGGRCSACVKSHGGVWEMLDRARATAVELEQRLAEVERIARAWVANAEGTRSGAALYTAGQMILAAINADHGGDES